MSRFLLIILISLFSFPLFSQTKEEAIVDKSFELLNQGKFDDAANNLKNIDIKAIEGNDSILSLYYYIFGRYYFESEDYYSAIKYMELMRQSSERVNLITPLYFVAMSSIASSYNAINDHKTAIEYARWAIIRGGEDSKYSYSYPSLLVAMGVSASKYKDPQADLYFKNGKESQIFLDSLYNISFEEGAKLYDDLINGYQQFKEEDSEFETLKLCNQDSALKWLITDDYIRGNDLHRLMLAYGPDTTMIPFYEENVRKYEKLENTKDINGYVIYSSLLSSLYNNLNKLELADKIIYDCSKKLKERGVSSELQYFLDLEKAGVYVGLQNPIDASYFLTKAAESIFKYKTYNYTMIYYLLLKAMVEFENSEVLAAKISIESAFDFFHHYNKYNDFSNMDLNDLMVWGRINYFSNVIDHSLGYEDKCISIWESIVDTSKKRIQSFDIFSAASVFLSSAMFRRGEYQKALDILNNVELNLTNLHKYFDFQVHYENKIAICSKLGLIPEMINEVQKYNQYQKRLLSNQDHLTFEEIEKYLYTNIDRGNGLINGMLYSNPCNELSIECYNRNLWSKNLLTNLSRNIRDEIKVLNNLEIEKKYDKYIQLKEELIYTTSYDDRSSKISEILSIEKEIKEYIYKNGGALKGKEIEWNDVKNSLKDGEAAIEIISIPSFSDDLQSADWIYCGLLVTPTCNSPKLLSLGKESDFNKIIDRGSIKESAFIRNIYTEGQTASRLYKMLWEPILAELIGTKTLYISAIGELEKLNFSQMLAPSGKRINDIINVRYVSSTALIESVRKDNIDWKEVALYGGINYSLDDNTKNTKQLNYKQNIKSNISFNTDIASRGTLNYLEGSLEEIKSISKELSKSSIPSYSLIGSDATEESFKNFDGNSPAIIHIATHGYFLDKWQVKRDHKFAGQLYGKTTQDFSFLCTGLLLAGANDAWNGIRPVEGVEDGILTAEEIARLDLSKTRLAVLSACESGLGYTDISGMMGLQRAFKMAGVQTIVMSLWKVPDIATTKLMTCFYQFLLQGIGAHEALYKAQQEISKEYPDPYYWAAFEVLD